MKIQTIFKGIRLDEVLAANCEAAAAKAHMTFSQWARTVLRHAVNGKSKRA